MNSTKENTPNSDSAGVFAAAHSLWVAIFEETDHPRKTNLSEAYGGIDQLMREVMRVSTLFETWSCRHIAFEETSEVWPYFIADRFGAAWLSVADAYSLGDFNKDDCLRVAWEMCLPIRQVAGIVLPVDVRATNPNPLSPFFELRIQTTRAPVDGGDVQPFTACDELFDEEFVSPAYSLYGHLVSGESEHIAERPTYEDLVTLTRKLIPEINFPSAPTSRRERG